MFMQKRGCLVENQHKYKLLFQRRQNSSKIQLAMTFKKDE